jgi:hypothetical protein
MEVETAHLVVSLTAGPVVFGDAVAGNHYPGAVVAKITVYENFLAGIIAQELQEGSDLVVGGTKDCAGGNLTLRMPKAATAFCSAWFLPVLRRSTTMEIPRLCSSR